MAITGSYAYMREKDITQNLTIGGNDREYKANLTVKGYDASVLMGYRFSKDSLCIFQEEFLKWNQKV